MRLGFINIIFRRVRFVIFAANEGYSGGFLITFFLRE